MKHWIGLLTLAFVASACGAHNQGTNLIDEIQAYNEGVRWHQYPRAAARVHPKERNAFVAELSSLAEEVRISEWDLVHVERPNRGRDRATAHVRYRWFRDSVGTLYETNTVQTWERHGKHWLVVAEKRVRGEPMPGVDEPDDDEEESDKRPHAAGSGAVSGDRAGPLTLRQMFFEFR